MDEEDNNIDESYGEVDEIVTESKPKRKRTPSTKNTYSPRHKVETLTKLTPDERMEQGRVNRSDGLIAPHQGLEFARNCYVNWESKVGERGITTAVINLMNATTRKVVNGKVALIDEPETVSMGSVDIRTRQFTNVIKLLTREKELVPDSQGQLCAVGSLRNLIETHRSSTSMAPSVHLEARLE